LFGEETGEYIDIAHWSANTARVTKVSIINVLQPKMGSQYPSDVVCEIEFSLKELSPQAKNEWKSIQKNEVVYLVSLGKEKDENTLAYMNEGFAKENGI
jgi:hypothetical protein